MTARRLAADLAALALLGALWGCAGHGRAQARPAPAAPPPAPSAGTTERAPTSPAPDTSLARGPVAPAAARIAAPWDTAATANGRAGQRNHVYPSGMSDIGKRLVDSLPDPAGVTVEAPPTPPAPAAPTPPASAPAPAAPSTTSAAPSIGQSGCWEVQLLVTSDRGRAQALAKKVAKQLNIAAWVRTTGALHRVRAGGCLSPDGALELARTLKAKGYPEAFRVMRESP